MRLYNTLTRRKEAAHFGDTIRMYVCGITPYDVTHLGHAFTYVSFDLLRRYLQHLGHRVQHIQNITDVDDDIIRRAAELGVTIEELARENVRDFDHDMAALNVLPADRYPRATEEVPFMVEMVSRLIAKGHGYQAGGNIYFDVTTYADYGGLSKLSPQEMVERALDKEKVGIRRPLDFLLWQAMQPGEPSWDSPWGRGRPGWHIECSAMALRSLGETLDIHGGGSDLVFPHHESERAQSESYTGVRPFVRFWVHTGMLRIGGEKMSKSLQNLVLVKDLLNRYAAPALRLYLLSFHYRSEPSYAEGDLLRVARGFDHLRWAATMTGTAEKGDPLTGEEERRAFFAALDDDLDTPQAIQAMFQLAAKIIGARYERDISPAQRQLREMADLLGLRLDHP